MLKKNTVLESKAKKIIAYLNGAKDQYAFWNSEECFMTQACFAYAAMTNTDQRVLILCDSISSAIDFHMVISEFSLRFTKSSSFLLCPHSNVDNNFANLQSANIVVCATICLDQLLVASGDSHKFDYVVISDLKQSVEGDNRFSNIINNVRLVLQNTQAFIFSTQNYHQLLSYVAQNFSINISEFQQLSDALLVQVRGRLVEHNVIEDVFLEDSTIKKEILKKATKLKSKIKAVDDALIASQTADVEIMITATSKPIKIKTQVISFDPEPTKIKKEKNITHEVQLVDNVENSFLDQPDNEVAPQVIIPQDTTPYGLMIERPLKRSLLIQLINQRNWQKVVIVTRTKHSAHRLEEKLFHNKLRARIIHGTLAPSAVEKNIEKFNNNEIRAIIVTDNALGLVEYPQLDAVIFFELPDLVENFFQRMKLFDSFAKNAEIITLFCNDESDWLNNLNQINTTQISVKPCQDLVALIGQNARQEHNNRVKNNRTTQEGVPRNNTPRRSDNRTRPSHSNRSTGRRMPDQNISGSVPPSPTEEIVKSEIIEPATVLENQNTNTSVKSNHPRGRSGRSPRNDNSRQREQFQKRDASQSRNVQRAKANQSSPTRNDYDGNNEQQGIVNQNRLPFELDSFEANIARENKRRSRNMYNGKPQSYNTSFDSSLFEQKPKDGGNAVKVSQRKRRTIDSDNIGNQ